MFVTAITTRDWFIHQNIGTLHVVYYTIPAAVAGVPGLQNQAIGGNNPTPSIPPSGGLRPDSSDSIVYVDSIQFTDVTIGQIQYDIVMGQHNLNGYAIEAAYIPVEVFNTGPVHWTILNYSAQAALVMFTYLSIPRASYDAYIAGMAAMNPMGQFGALRVR